MKRKTRKITKGVGPGEAWEALEENDSIYVQIMSHLPFETKHFPYMLDDDFEYIDNPDFDESAFNKSLRRVRAKYAITQKARRANEGS